MPQEKSKTMPMQSFGGYVKEVYYGISAPVNDEFLYSRHQSTNKCIKPRENEGTETESQGVGRDMSCPRKLFLDERKSLF